ncbi:DASH family cryptochrome [Agarilytica rhodophyticola]|uniref:DASH family cryptochrome n=1 Tax=Agarilytica rhodophyticola TaxID=1737490 RepID=UPI001FEBEAC0|nr:DASH family cryptochrome [Agarilytica rhodophyticola]
MPEWQRQAQPKSTIAMASTLLVFENDLRLHDNPALLKAVAMEQPLICLFCMDNTWFRRNAFGLKRMGAHRYNFLKESLTSLHHSLMSKGQKLNVLYGSALEVIPSLVAKYDINTVIKSHHPGFYENRQWLNLQKICTEVKFYNLHTATLFDSQQLDRVSAFADTFSKFKKLMFDVSPVPAVDAPAELPPPLTVEHSIDKIPHHPQTKCELFKGGERSALKHILSYFSSNSPSTYKLTRNAFEGWSYSCKFSPWLANGNISVRLLFQKLKEFEENNEANESTYWIYFELLWREYFYWYAQHHGKNLFRFSGIGNKRPLTTFYPQRFQKWCLGQTPWPIVNACMTELNTTGFMSNRGRQVVASCLVNELQLDWRCGAAYFEQQLIDYDVGTNWGNWQYIAGVGADPRGGRHFDLTKQQRRYDPEGTFVKRWQRGSPAPVDHTDAADWPIEQHDYY